MMKFVVFRKGIGRKFIGEYTAREIDEMRLDLRLYEITPKHLYKRINKEVPSSILKVMAKEDGKWKEMYFPVFDFSELDKLYISTSNHLVLKDSLNKVQRLWLEKNREAESIM